MTLWFSEISGNEWGITSFSSPDSSSCSQQGHCSWIPRVIFLKVTGRAQLEMASDSGTSSSPACAEFGHLLGHAAKDISDSTDLSEFGWLNSWWIDHLILLRFHLSVNYVRVPQMWDRRLLPFFGIFVGFFSLFRYFKLNGISWSVLLNLTEDKYCIIYYFNVILVLYRINYRTNSFFLLTAPEKVVVLQTSNFVQKNEKNFAIY